MCHKVAWLFKRPIVNMEYASIKDFQTGILPFERKNGLPKQSKDDLNIYQKKHLSIVC